MKLKKGMSLIILVITMIIIIILASAVMFSLSYNNPIDKATEAQFKVNVSSYKSQLAIYIDSSYVQNRSFNPNDFYALSWNGNPDNILGTVKECITNMTEYDGPNFEVRKGKLVYVGSQIDQINWVTDMGITTSVPSL